MTNNARMKAAAKKWQAPRPRNQERGSIFFYLLLAVALFSAINFVMSNIGKTGGGQQFTEERNRMMASEIVTQGNQLAEAVAKLRLRGIPASQISFVHKDENAVPGTIYTNANCTTDKCQVFALNGGGLEPLKPVPNTNNGEMLVYTGTLRLDTAGNTANDLIAIMPNVSEAVCTEINRLTGSPIPLTSQTLPLTTKTLTADMYQGTLGTGTGTNHIGVNRAGCLRIASLSGTGIVNRLTAAVTLPADTYNYYVLLHQR